MTDEEILEKEHDPLTYAVIGAAIEVHKLMGPGLLESVYQRCMEHELKLRGIAFRPQQRIELRYKDMPLDDELVIDIFFPGEMVVELKAVEKVIPVHEAQLLTYLKLTGTKRGVLINFNVPVLRNGVIRRVN